MAATQTDSRRAEALEKLCRTYWFPIYVYVRCLGHDSEDARDLTQAFFARVLEKRYLDSADRNKGKFRSFLLTILKGFLANEWDRDHRLKRGGGCEIIPLDDESTEARYRTEVIDEAIPESAFQRRWAITLLDQVLNRLESELVVEDKGDFFNALKPFLTGDGEGTAYAEIASTLAMTEGALRVAVHRLRQRYRELLRFEIAQTVSCPEEIDEEIRCLFAALAS